MNKERMIAARYTALHTSNYESQVSADLIIKMIAGCYGY